MKNKRLLLGALLSLTALLPVASSCKDLVGDKGDSLKGTILLRFPRDIDLSTRAAPSPLDTNEFLLSIKDARGNSVFEGRYGAAPDAFLTTPGTYSIDVRSAEFSEPAFDSPQYGDSQVVSVQAGKTVSVLLNCYQTNSALKLGIDPTFTYDHPQGALYVKAAEGRLMYSYAEKRTAYFKPGSVTLTMMENGTEEVLFTRSVAAQQVLHVKLSSATGKAPDEAPGHLTIQVDTSRYWIHEDYVLGGENAGSDPPSAYSVTEARTLGTANDVWVYGYIVGGDLSSSKCSFEAPFSSRTNLVLASKSACRDKESCLSVQLAKGDVRDALNLVDHEDLLGRQVFLKGDIVEAYYGIPGLQNISQYELR